MSSCVERFWSLLVVGISGGELDLTQGLPNCCEGIGDYSNVSEVAGA